jgi:nicotinamidase-related amidase
MRGEPLHPTSVPTESSKRRAGLQGTAARTRPLLPVTNQSPFTPQTLTSGEAPGASEAVPARAAHLCLDMQNLIGPAGPWAAKWAERVLPSVARLVEHAPARTIFTRFIPPAEPGQARGAWRDFYRKWERLTLKEIDPHALELMDALKLFVPPARVLDKHTYSAFGAPRLASELQSLGAEAIIVSGAESDMCVLATVLAAIDLGFPVIVAADAVCSASDACHDAVQQVYHQRFSQQVRTLEVEEIRALWQPAKV